jgi:hypothetical protein
MPSPQPHYPADYLLRLAMEQLPLRVVFRSSAMKGAGLLWFLFSVPGAVACLT